MWDRVIPSTLRGRLAATFAVTSLIIVIAVGLFLAIAIEDRYEERLARQLDHEALLAAAALSSAGLSPADPATLDREVKQLGASIDTRIVVIDADGRVIADSDLPATTEPADRDEGAGGAGIEQPGWLVGQAPFPGDSGAVVQASAPLEVLDGSVWELRRQVLLAAVAVAVLSVLAALAISRRITDPLDELRRHSAMVASGKLDVTVLPADTRELGELARSFNAMTRRVRELVEESERTRSRLEAIFANLSDGVIVVDARQQVLSMNAMAARMLETRLSEAIGKPFMLAVRDVDLHRLLQGAYETSSAVSGTIDYARSGRVFDAVAQLVSSGNERLAIVVIRDVTELRRLETVRREFVANVSHELRTPLASIRALVETLEAGAIDDPAVARDFFGRVIGEVDRLTALVDELLDLGRLESGRIALKLAEVSPVVLVEGGVERLRAQIERARLDLILDVPADLPAVSADRARIEQVLLNLLHNAIKFTPPGGRITISARRENGSVAVSVADTGSGIGSAELPRVFERFYKSDKARRSDGTGLGLAIAKHIVHAHGGAIWVESAPGQGSTFTFTLPVHDRARAARHDAGRQPAFS